MNTPLIILFGSQARKTAGKSSDTDIAVLYDHELTLAEKNAIGEEIARELAISEDTVDVVDLRKSPPLLQYRIAQEGKLLRGTEEDFIRFKVRAWKLYLDTARFRRAREQSLAHHINAK